MNTATEVTPSGAIAATAAIATATADPMLLNELREMNTRLRRIEAAVVGLERRVESVEELREDIWPAVQGIAHHLNTTLVGLEETGSLDFAKEAIGVARMISTSFSPDEVHQLGENVVGILHTVRNLTQPEVLDVADRAVVAFRASETSKSKPRIFRTMRDPEVRRGMTRMLAVLKEVGSEQKAGELTRPPATTT